MSAPEQPPPEQQFDPTPAPEPPPDDGSSLVPALLVVYGAYLIWRGAYHRTPTGWRQVMLALGLRGLIGAQLAMVAARGLGAQRTEAGRPGDELWGSVESGIQAGVDAGLQTIAQALIWTDRTVPPGDTPPTADEGGVVPTLAAPPELLAQMTAAAVINAAQFAAAVGAGWQSKTWRSRRDNRVRDTHVALNGTKLPMTSVFTSPSGAKLRFPGDPRAPIAERANCRCVLLMSRR